MRPILSFILLLSICTSAFAANVDTAAIYSASMHKTIKCVVITPSSYLKQKDKKYPVLYLLHGFSDNYAGWVSKAKDLKEAVDENDLIVVCPDGGYSSWYFDSPVDTTYKYETHITGEVLNYIDQHYRTLPQRNARAIAGLSMGGHGALYLAIRHKDLYSAAISLSGGVDITPFPDNWQLADRLGTYKEHRDVWQQHSVQYLSRHLNDNELAIVLDCGTDDFFIGVNRILHQQLKELNIAHDYIERPGSHNWAYWNNAIVYQIYYLKKLFQQQLK